MRILVGFLAGITGAWGQWSDLVLKFEGVGCATCIESMPERLKRVRGVEQVDVDAAQGLLKIHLAPENRVRLEQLRDFIGQDGTKVTRIEAEGRGRVEQEEGKWLLRLPGQIGGYWLDPKDKRIEAGEIRIKGVITEVARGQERMTIACEAIESSR